MLFLKHYIIKRLIQYQPQLFHFVMLEQGQTFKHLDCKEAFALSLRERRKHLQSSLRHVMFKRQRRISLQIQERQVLQTRGSHLLQPPPFCSYNHDTTLQRETPVEFRFTTTILFHLNTAKYVPIKRYQRVLINECDIYI